MTVQVLDDGRTDGSNMGGGVTNAKLSFFSSSSTTATPVTPVVQPSGGAQAAITRGTGGGIVATFAHVNSPASVATISTAELGMTLVGGTGAPITIATTDMIAVVTKPTSQAGLGIGNVRVSSAGVIGVEFVNLSAGFLTPTATQTYGTVALRGLNSVTSALTPASVASNTTAEQLFTVTVRAGELVSVNKATSQPGLAIAGVRVAGANSLGITFMNTTAGPLTPTAAQTYTVISLGGLDATNNEVLFQVSGAAQASLAVVTNAASTLTITNIGVTDTVLGIQRPTNQLGLITAGGFVSAAGVAAVVFANFTTASFLTPTANEVYSVKIWRAAPVAPLRLYTPSLTPSSVAANTTAEQGFTVTGLVASSPVWVNKPTSQIGLGILGCRVSAADTLAITFANCTSTAITPTAAETYTVGNFQMPIDVGGNSIIQSANLAIQQANTLANATRSGLVSLGLLAGS